MLYQNVFYLYVNYYFLCRYICLANSQVLSVLSYTQVQTPVPDVLRTAPFICHRVTTLLLCFVKGLIFFFFFQLQKLLDLDENMFGFFFNIYFLPFLRVEKAIKKVAKLNARSCADEKNIKSLWKKSQRHISVFTTWRF